MKRRQEGRQSRGAKIPKTGMERAKEDGEAGREIEEESWVLPNPKTVLGAPEKVMNKEQFITNI